MESFWISIKSFVVTVLLLGSAVLVAGDGDCTYPKNPSCSCSDMDTFNPGVWCSQPKYYVPPTFPRFIAQPTSKIRNLRSNDSVTMTCQISSNLANFSIIWEHDGTPINNSSMYDGFIDSSTLTIKRPSLAESEGGYRCRVNYQHGNFSLVSREARFEAPRFSGWVDSISGNNTPVTSNTTTVAVQEGESFILECNPSTNDPSISIVSAVWTRNYMRINSDSDEVIVLEGGNSLLVRNFTSGGANRNMTFQCLFSGLRYLEELQRTFVITPAKGETPQNFLVPQNQTVLPGTKVNLYCLSKLESSMNDNNTWLFNNITLDQISHSNHYDIVDRGQVLVIRTVTMETSGVYTCHTASGEEYLAFVDILGDVIIESSTHNFSEDGQIDIDTETTATNHTITLSCHAGNHGDHNNLNVEWSFRGRLVNSTASYSSSSNLRSQNRAAVIFIERENALTMISADPWELIGTVQCFVSIASPTGANNLDEVKSTSIHILARGKPNPPSSFTEVRRMDNMRSFYKYQIAYKNAYCLPGEEGMYVLEVLIQNDSYKQLCTCRREDCHINFDTTPWLEVYNKSMYIRVAYEVNGVLSDFLPLVNQTTDPCRLPFSVDRNPPAPTFHDPPNFKLSSRNPYQWDVTQKWNTTDECKYPNTLYHKYTSLSCPKHNQPKKEWLNDERDFTYTVPCLTTCEFKVTVQVSQYTNFSTTTITTPPIAPTEPPTVDGIERVNETSFGIHVTLLNEDISCVEEPPNLVVNYTNAGSNISSTVLIDIENCTRLINDATTSYVMCRVTDEDENACLDEYEVIVAYQSIIGSEDHFSNFGNAPPLQGPSEESILAGVSMNVISTSSNEITVNFNISQNVTCITQGERRIIAYICPTNETSCIQSVAADPTNCQNRTVEENTVTFQGLDPNSTHCIMAKISYGARGTNHVYTQSIRSTTSGHSSTSHVTSEPPSNKNPGVTVWEAAVVAVLLAIVCVLAVACIFTTCCCYYRRKKLGNYYRLTNRDDASITSQDPVNPAERAESVHSERTDPEFMVRRLLKDVKGQPDGDEDHTIMCEDYTGHQGDGKFNDVERESLQGFGEAAELVETENASTTGSPQDQRKLILNNNPIQNQPYQASARQDEALELSPLRTSSTAIPSIISSYALSSSTKAPPPNGQRTVPDGYVGDKNINVRSEGFHNPACTLSLLGNVTGGPMPPTTSTPTNQIPAHNVISGHMTSQNEPHFQRNQQPVSQQPIPPPNNGYRSLGTVSSISTQPTGDRSQGMVAFNNRPVSSAVLASSNGGCVRSSQLPSVQVIPQQQLGGDSSFNQIHLSSNNENSTQNLNLQPSFNLSADGYVQNPTSMTSDGDSSTLNLNSQPSLSEHILSADEYVQEETTVIGGGGREERGLSAESGNEDDSLSNEGDSNSVFDDDLTLSENPVHSVRPRSTVTSGFQSGSSESASSPEPPKKSTSSLSSLPSSVSTVLPPSTLNIHAPVMRKDNISPCSTNSSLNPSSDSFPPHTPHSHSSASISHTPVAESTFIYRPLSTGGSSGYVTNDSSQSYMYHSSSATSQTSQTSALAPSEIEQEVDIESVKNQKYTLPSLLSCSSKSSSPGLSRAAAAGWMTKGASMAQTDSANTRHLQHYSHHIQTTSATVTDYVNTSDVDLSKISTELGELSQSSETVTSAHQDVSFVFPVSSS